MAYFYKGQDLDAFAVSLEILSDDIQAQQHKMAKLGDFLGSFHANNSLRQASTLVSDAKARVRALREDVASGKITDSQPTSERPEPAEAVIHTIEPFSGLTTCCKRTPFELPRTERVSAYPNQATCKG